MFCTKCGKEIPEGENKLCEDCQKELVNSISSDEAQEIDSKKSKKQPFKKMKEKIAKNKVVLIIAIVVIFLAILLVNIFATSNVGNTIGNIRNYGYAAKSGNWLYFLSPNEDSTQIGIFKMKEGDTSQKSKKQLVMDSWDILSLNVSGNYLYFIGISSELFSEEDNVNNKIYRMKTDGTDLKVINDNEFDNDCYEIYVVNGKVYYIGTDYNVYRMNTDGSNRELVLENQTGYLGITDEYIIYNVLNEDESDYITYISDTNGKNARPIIENTRLYSVNIVDDYIYYTNESKQICKVKIDGTNQAVMYETTAYNMNVSGKDIYYLNYADEANADYTVCLYKVKTDGSTETPEVIKTLETYSSFIDIIGNWIIYMDSNDTEGFINLLKTDGKEEIKVYSLNYTELYETEEGTEETDETTEPAPTDEEVENEKTATTVTGENTTTESDNSGTNTTDDLDTATP